ncbi:hypothetical protein CYMTET_55101 [Cymbomonas tetramitiformis]|uniref:Uncharacterized protein n=1 Tax=Cymbomonas tetramitiformis TaxID=36881 RepID=A0AAE0EPY9_9CHLO|nr:hypothetical protein CYMTET_55101 [Cymbomonas tetramitiformis]
MFCAHVPTCSSCQSTKLVRIPEGEVCQDCATVDEASVLWTNTREQFTSEFEEVYNDDVDMGGSSASHMKVVAMVESVAHDGCLPRFPDFFTRKFKLTVYVYKKIWKQMKDAALGHDIEAFAGISDFWKSILFCAHARCKYQVRALLDEWLISKHTIAMPLSARDSINAKKLKCFKYLARYMLSMHVVESGLTKLGNATAAFDDLIAALITYPAIFSAGVDMFNEVMHKQNVRTIADETVRNTRTENRGVVKLSHKDGVRITCNAWVRHIENWNWSTDEKHKFKTIVRISFGMLISAWKEWMSVIHYLPPVFFELNLRLQSNEQASALTSRVELRPIIGM